MFLVGGGQLVRYSIQLPIQIFGGSRMTDSCFAAARLGDASVFNETRTSRGYASQSEETMLDTASKKRSDFAPDTSIAVKSVAKDTRNDVDETAPPASATLRSPTPLSRSAPKEPRIERIARRAHEIYVARGGEHGKALDDWLRAEREIDAEDEQERPPDART